MSYSTKSNSTTSTRRNDQRIPDFASAMERSVGSKAPLCSGENGSDMYTMYGNAGEGHPVIGALVALFSGIVDTSSPESCEEFVENVRDQIVKSTDLTPQQKAYFMADLIVSAFQCRDIRNNGKGRRDQSRAMFLKLLSYFPDTMIALLPEWKEHGCWKDYNKLLEQFSQGQKYNGTKMTHLVTEIYDLYSEQLQIDRAVYDSWVQRKEEAENRQEAFTERCTLSLAAKWVGKEGRSLDRNCKCAKEFAKRIFPELFAKDFKQAMKAFRKFYGPLQDAIRTTEKLECAGDFDKIKFQFVPGKCLFKKKKAYLYEKKTGGELRGDDPKRIECRDNLMDHLKKAVTGKATIHGKTLYLHELCAEVYGKWTSLTEGDKLVIEAQYLDHVKHFRELMKEKGMAIDKGCVLADFSGSMGGDPMNGAMAIAILVSDLSEGAFSDKFMSFETNPHWIILSYPKTREEFDAMMNGTGNRNSFGGYGYGRQTNPLGSWDPSRAGGKLTFVEKVGVCYTSPWGGSTDFLAAHDLILDVCVKHRVSAPEWLMTVSDMQFNVAARGNGSGLYTTMCDLLRIRTWEEVDKNYVPPHGRASYSYGQRAVKTTKWEDHDTILTSAYKAAGVRKPQMIYWNMRESNKSLVCTADAPNVQQVAGFSTMQLKLFLEDMELDPDKSKKPVVTPWDTFRKAMDDECYDDIRTTIASTGEKVFKNYVLPSDSGDKVNSDENVKTNSEKDESTEEAPLERLRAAKKMLDEDLINDKEFSAIKEKVLSMM